MRRIHLLLTVQTLVVILISINRLSSLTTGYVAANEFLRWVDFHNMLTLPLISLVAFYFLKVTLEGNQTPRRQGYQVVGLLFFLGLYLYGVGYGAHEVTNYLHVRFCLDAPSSDLCRIISFNDDDFSHWIWFIGFTLINAALLLTQALFPTGQKVARTDLGWLGFNGLFIALGIFANLAFEPIGLDLYVVLALALLAGGGWGRYGRQPLFVYYTIAYAVGLVATVIAKLL